MIEVDKASFRYGDEWVFRGVSFTLAKGETAAILGPNGKGKTTLLKSIIGLHSLAEGTAKTHGNYGYVAQKTDMSFAYKVIDLVVMGRASHVGLFQMPSHQDYQIARRTLDRLGIGDFVDRIFTQLSGGERQLVMIARALASECEILVMDEPTSALDFLNQSVIMDTLRRITVEDGLTVLMTTHVPQQAQLLADKVLLMHETDRQEWGAAHDMLSEERLNSLYGVPIKSVTFEHNGKSISALVPLFI